MGKVVLDIVWDNLGLVIRWCGINRCARSEGVVQSIR